MKTFIQPGDVVTVAAPANVLSGAMVRIASLVGVATHGALSGQPVEIAISGMFTLPKVAAQAWTVGIPVFLVPGSGLVTSVAGTGNLFIGVAMAAAADPTPTGVVRLNGSLPAAVTA